MKTMLTTVSELFDVVQLDPRQPPASAISRAERRPGLITIWIERSRFRDELARMATDMPELIDDIGLTMEQARAEIAKPFWRR
ncbi:hypothetical protein LHFGNBLO_004818 [Mesorhizobium sp. AR10]|uniref:DUF1127 domain-containing protein n=1 Tax=Mesorhizobium sp. AR10 TaxID=2865839 RepID=UPI0021608624|nr:hypothetical protein [Mesorhizobium sp. AR10]UVK37736.1 hypothetical protein LHFGNBLO_004818 [Mesorhizobium sp. AR10]